MRIGNCNCGKQLDCGCVPYFDTFLTNTVSVLSVGNLVSDSCVFDEYVIDWFHDGEHAMVTGKGYDPAIQEFHPFLGDASLPVIGGQWKPVLRYVVINGAKIYPIPKKCQNWCADLDVALPSAEVPYINIINLACGMTGGGASSLYDYKIFYNTTQDYSLATKTIRYFIDDNAGFVAYLFDGAQVADQIEFFYNDEVTPLASYIVGTNLPTTSVNASPEEIDINVIYSVINLTGHSFSPGDYLTIKIKPSVKEPGNYNTIWTLELKCLPSGYFSCGDFNADIKTINPSTVNLTWDAVNCRYNFRFLTVAGRTPTNFTRYFSPVYVSAANTVSITASGDYTIYLRKSRVATSTPVYLTGTYVNMSGSFTAIKNGNIITLEFTHQTDYDAYKASFNSLSNHATYLAYTSDKTNLNHYKWYFLNWRETLLTCGDSFVNRTFYFHRSSPISFNDGARIITIEMLNTTNELPVADCDSTPQMANSYIETVNSSIISPDFTGTTKCRNAYPFNMYNQGATITNETQRIVRGLFYLHSKSLDTVCQNSDWIVAPSTGRYEFTLYHIRVTLTNPDDALNNYRLETQLDISTGVSTGIWQIIYEKQNGVQIIP